MWKTAPNRFQCTTGASSAICFQFHLPVCLCSQQIPSIHLSLSLLLPLPPHQFDTLAMWSVCYTWQDYVSSRSLEDIKNQKILIDFRYDIFGKYWNLTHTCAFTRTHSLKTVFPFSNLFYGFSIHLPLKVILNCVCLTIIWWRS